MLLADGAAAVVLAREGKTRLAVTDGVPFFRQSQAGESLASALRSLEERPASVIGSAQWHLH